MQQGGRKFSSSSIATLNKLSIKENFPIKVYRGLVFSNSDFLKRFSVSFYKKIKRIKQFVYLKNPRTELVVLVNPKLTQMLILKMSS